MIKNFKSRIKNIFTLKAWNHAENTKIKIQDAILIIYFLSRDHFWQNRPLTHICCDLICIFDVLFKLI